MCVRCVWCLCVLSELYLCCVRVVVYSRGRFAAFYLAFYYFFFGRMVCDDFPPLSLSLSSSLSFFRLIFLYFHFVF